LKAEQKRFRSLMWEFHRDPKDLKPEQREALDRLFIELPVLKDVYDVRVRFKEIFDTAPERASAEQPLAELERADRIAGVGLRQVLDDLRELEDRHPPLLRRALHQRRGRGDQQQGPGDHQALLRGQVVQHALEPAEKWARTARRAAICPCVFAGAAASSAKQASWHRGPGERLHALAARDMQSDGPLKLLGGLAKPECDQLNHFRVFRRFAPGIRAGWRKNIVQQGEEAARQAPAAGGWSGGGYLAAPHQVPALAAVIARQRVDE